MPRKTTFEYTHDAEKHERNAAGDSEGMDCTAFTIEWDIRESAIFVHLNTNSLLFSSRDSSIICATSIACTA